MTQKIDLETIAKETLKGIHRHGLEPIIMSISVALDSDDFERFITGFPDRDHPEIVIRNGKLDGVQWQIQVLKQRSLKDFSTGAISTPPPDK